MADTVKYSKRIVKENVDPLEKKGTQWQRTKARALNCLFRVSFHWLVLLSGLAGPWTSYGTEATPAVMEDILEALEPNWSQRRQKHQICCTPGFWTILVIRTGSWWLSNCKRHTHLQGGQEEDLGSYKASPLSLGKLQSNASGSHC